MENDDNIKEIINSLDAYSRTYDPYEYGLPVAGDEEMAEMITIVRKLLTTLPMREGGHS